MANWMGWLKMGLIAWSALALLISCDENNAPTAALNTEPSSQTGLPADPGPGKLAGIVRGTTTHSPLAGLTVTLGQRRAQTASDGTFRLDGVEAGQRVLAVFGDAIYARGVTINAAQGRVVQFDAIEQQSAFDLGFYRELVRGHHPQEGRLLPLQRWTAVTPPTIYIDTNPSATLNHTIDPAVIATTEQTLREILPVFSGGQYVTANIATRAFAQHDFAAIPDHTIVISFDDTLSQRGALGVTFTDATPGANGAINKAWVFLMHQEDFYHASHVARTVLTAHELGHAFGYWHTSQQPSVMAKDLSYAGLFSPADELHMRIAYTRPVGNTDIDQDPAPTANQLVETPQQRMHVEERREYR